MRRPKFHPALTLAALALGVAATLAGTARAADDLRVTAPFAFRAGSAVLPSGTYAMVVRWADDVLTLRDSRTGRGVEVPLVTRLAKPPAAKAEPARFVFDKAGDGSDTLSEVWLPDSEGVLVGSTPGRHEHHVVVPKT